MCAVGISRHVNNIPSTFLSFNSKHLQKKKVYINKVKYTVNIKQWFPECGKKIYVLGIVAETSWCPKPLRHNLLYHSKME
jgi:hypothetical protein